MGYRGSDRFATDPTGAIAAGAPGGIRGLSPFGGSGFSIGRVGRPVANVSGPPGTTQGTGFGGTFSIPIGGQQKGRSSTDRAKGGKIESEPTGGKSRNKAKRYSKGGSTASKRADGCATKGKTKGRFV